MRRPLPYVVSALVLALALGSGPLMAAPAPGMDPAVLALHRARQPERVARAEAQLASLRSHLGLGERDAFVARHAFTNSEGEAIVRLEQTHDGHRVWGGQAIAHVLPEGGLRTITKSVRTGITLTGNPLLTGDQALKIALAHLAPKGPMKDAPQVERVVFPAQFLGGLATKLDKGTNRPVLDREHTVFARLDQPHVWAYEVRTRLHNQQDGNRELTYVIDGNTGKVLRVEDRVQHLEAITPAQGTGIGFYRGEGVALNSTQMLDGSFLLMDTTRGIKANPSLQYYAADPVTGWDPLLPGLQVFFNINDADGFTTYMQQLFQSSVNSWGDGLPFTNWANEGGTNGQTAGVDAMSAMTTTWDFYQNVFGRSGMDGQGTAVVSTVLMTPSPFNNYYRDNADWSTWGQSLQLGAGTFRLGNPKGLDSLTDLDIVAHEMTHGVTSPSQSQYWVNSAGYEEAGLNEATSDFFAQMVKAYARRTPGEDTTIPSTDGEWQIGKAVGHGTPIRWLDKPSLDLRSVDGWYDGIKYMDGHFSAGPLNRAFYFLANGASSTPGDPAYSPYLPAGMAGIGNDAAARVVYKAVTEFLVGDGTGAITFQEVREACLTAASLYNYGYSHWIPAIRNAFAAANIGDAHNQVTPRTQVLFTDWRHNDYIESTHFTDYATRQIFPMGETVRPRVTVLNNSNTAVTWSLGGPSLFNGAADIVSKGGVINADGSWTAPSVVGWEAITATSKADPNQFAEGRVFLINMDTDMDGEIDALDMAGVAASWYLWGALNPAHSMFEAPLVDDGDVSFFVDAMKSTWPVK